MRSDPLASLDLIVFDWDGTLADSIALIAGSIRAAAADLDLPVPDYARASHVIGLGLDDALAHAVPGLAAERRVDFARRYRFHYLAREAEVRLFAGAGELLQALVAAGARLAIATGKTRAGIDRALAATGVARHFVAVRGADESRPKPDPAMLHALMAECAAAPDRTLMVGDTTHDLQMALAAGTRAAAVAYGAHPRAQLAGAGPERVFDSVPQLHRWLLSS